jgi:hypothetical protein
LLVCFLIINNKDYNDNYQTTLHKMSKPIDEDSETEEETLQEVDTACNTLPLDVVYHISSFLPDDSLLTFQFSCKTFYEIASQDELWQNLVKKKFEEDYHLIYRNIGKSKYPHFASYKRLFALLASSVRGHTFRCLECCEPTTNIVYFRSCGSLRIIMCKVCRANLLLNRDSALLDVLSKEELVSMQQFSSWPKKYYDIREVFAVLRARSDRIDDWKKNLDLEFAFKCYNRSYHVTENRNRLRTSLTRKHKLSDDEMIEAMSEERIMLKKQVQSDIEETSLKIKDHFTVWKECYDFFSKQIGRSLSFADKYIIKTYIQKKGIRRHQISQVIKKTEHFEAVVKLLQANSVKLESRRVKDNANKYTRDKLLDTFDIASIPPFCESLIGEYTSDELVDMVEREHKLMKKCSKMGYNYRFLDYRIASVEHYIRFNDVWSIYRVVYSLVSPYFNTANDQNSIRIRKTIMNLTTLEKVNLVHHFCKFMETKWHEKDFQFDQVMSQIRALVQTCNFSNMRSVNQQDANLLFSAKMQQSIVAMVTDMITFLMDHGSYGMVIQWVFIEHFVRQKGVEPYLKRKAQDKKIKLNKLHKRKRTKDAEEQPEQEIDSIATRAKKQRRLRK